MNRSTTTKTAEIGALIAATVVTAWTLRSISSWRGALADPCLIAIIASVGTIAFLWGSVWFGPRALKAELMLLAAFLLAMPFVYAARYLFVMNAAIQWKWLGLESVGIPLFAVPALRGLKRSPWFLALGIAAHGLGWDMWHYKNSAYIPNWYSAFCFLLDLALAMYVSARLAYGRTRRI